MVSLSSEYVEGYPQARMFPGSILGWINLVNERLNKIISGRCNYQKLVKTQEFIIIDTSKSGNRTHNLSQVGISFFERKLERNNP